ncbi:MAG: hypothetical protein ACLP4R_00960 [Solirubrobacteraceae bacterium]
MSIGTVACADAVNEAVGNACVVMFFGPPHRLGHRGPASRSFIPGRYLTDDRSLFGVVSRLEAGRRNALVALEGCVTLEVRAYAPGGLGAKGLGVVRSAHALTVVPGTIAEARLSDDRALAIPRTGAG